MKIPPIEIIEGFLMSKKELKGIKIHKDDKPLVKSIERKK